MKTTMQELIEWIDKFEPYGLSRADVRHKATELCAKEKQHIIDAVEWNYKSNMGEVYYKAKFSESQPINERQCGKGQNIA